MINQSNLAQCKNAIYAALIASVLLSCGGNSTPHEGTSPELPPFFIGNHARTTFIRDDFPLYWSQLTPEVDGFWGSVENYRNNYDWQRLDALYKFAEQHALTLKAHALISRDMLPNWANSLGPTDFAKEIESWIQDYCSRFPNTAMINVVYNGMPGHANMTIFANALGPDWAIRAFKLARQYCPDSVLILDDYYLLSKDTDLFLEWAAPIIASGFVDAIGVQAQELENVNIQDVSANLDKLAALGLPIYISEWDIAEQDDARQLELMQQQFPIFYHHPAVAGITYWGYIANQQFIRNANLLNEDDSPRPAMTWLQNYLEENPRN